jgi:hypothetical protein
MTDPSHIDLRNLVFSAGVIPFRNSEPPRIRYTRPDLRHAIADDREVTMSDQTPPRQFRARISTLLSLVAIAALLVVVVMQQVRIERMQRTMAAELQQKTQKLTTIIREQRDYIERQRAAPSAPQPGR